MTSTLDPGGRRARAEHEETKTTQCVCEPEDERKLGPDDDEIDLERARQSEDSLGVLGADRMTLGDRGDTRVAGCGVELGQRRRLRELPGERVLTTAGADDENPHRASLMSRRHASGQ